LGGDDVSKFSDGLFHDGDGKSYYCVSKERYAKESAINMAEHEFDCCANDLLLEDVWVRWQIWWDYGEKNVGWYFHCNEVSRSCPAWAFSTRRCE
jgi:hypothetical protein